MTTERVNAGKCQGFAQDLLQMHNDGSGDIFGLAGLEICSHVSFCLGLHFVKYKLYLQSAVCI